MDLGRYILEFFHDHGTETDESQLTFGKILNALGMHYSSSEIMSAINKLMLEGHLVMTSPGAFSINGNAYETTEYLVYDADYGVYEFILYGFYKIHERFKHSVKPIIIITSDGNHSIGTGFLVDYYGNKCMLTARHCIDLEGTILIYDNSNNITIPSNIFLPEHSEYYGDPGFEHQNLDLCALTFSDSFFNGNNLFQLTNPRILDEIMVLGYPTTGLFDSGADVNNAVLISEKASIAHQYLKGTQGQTTGSGKLPSTSLDYFLISARVKGGNSGGPVINKHGKVVGMVCQVPLDDTTSASEKVDGLGFGFACPSETIVKFISSILGHSNDIRVTSIIPEVLKQGFKMP